MRGNSYRGFKSHPLRQPKSTLTVSVLLGCDTISRQAAVLYIISVAVTAPLEINYLGGTVMPLKASVRGSAAEWQPLIAMIVATIEIDDVAQLAAGQEEWDCPLVLGDHP